jgi:hypothetical protein
MVQLHCRLIIQLKHQKQAIQVLMAIAKTSFLHGERTRDLEGIP